MGQPVHIFIGFSLVGRGNAGKKSGGDHEHTSPSKYHKNRQKLNQSLSPHSRSMIKPGAETKDKVWSPMKAKIYLPHL